MRCRHIPEEDVARYTATEDRADQRPVSPRGPAFLILVFVIVRATSFAQAQPVEAPVVFEGGVVNAASFLRPPVAGSGLAQGSLISIFGGNLGPEPGVSAEFPLTSELAGVSIEIQTAEGGALAAIPIFVSSGQINALLPSATPVGLNLLSVRREGAASGPAALKVVRSSFGLFAFGSGVVRDAVAQRFVSESEQPLATREAPARPGDTVVLWGTGLGPVAGPETSASEAGALDTPVEVMVGHRNAAITYQGRAPCCVGLDQINIRIPEETPAGCFVPVWVSVSGTVHSNIATIPISEDGGACRENPALPTPLTGAPTGRVLLRRVTDLDESLNPIAATTRDTAIGWFRAPAEVLAAAVSPETTATVARTAREIDLAPLQAADLAAVPPQGTCLVYDSVAEEGFYFRDSLFLDAGARLELVGPGGRVEVPKSAEEYRLAAPPAALFLGAGDYGLQGFGGSGFPAFAAEILSGDPARWRVRGDTEGEARLRGVSVEWELAGREPNSILLVGREAVAAPGAGEEIPAPTRFGFVCAASNTALEFAIPPAVLANLSEATAALELASVWGPRVLEFPTDGPETGSLVYLGAQRSSVRLGQPQLPSTPVALPDGTEVQAELALSFAERQRGLMSRRELPSSQGMLFLFENPGRYGFWMLNTLVPLDIVWVDSERRVVFVSENTPPCPAGTFCPTYGSDVVAQFVLELAAGQAAAHGVTVGARLDW